MIKEQTAYIKKIDKYITQESKKEENDDSEIVEENLDVETINDKTSDEDVPALFSLRKSPYYQSKIVWR